MTDCKHAYSVLMEYLGMQEGGDYLQKLVEQGRKIPRCFDYIDLVNLAIDFRNDIRTQAAKGAGKTNPYKAAMNIIKNAKKNANTALHGAFMRDGMQCVCDGYHALRFREAMDMPSCDGIDMSRFGDGELKREYNIALEVPTIADMKMYIAERKHEFKEPTYKFGAVLPAVNAKYLLDMLLGLKNCKMYFSGNYNAPIYCEGDNGDGFIMPVRIDRSKEKTT